MRVQIGGPQPLAGGHVAGIQFRDPDLYSGFSHDHVFTKRLSNCALPAPSTTARHSHMPADVPHALPGAHEHSERPPSRLFRNVDAPLAAVRPPPSTPLSVYHSLSIVPIPRSSGRSSRTSPSATRDRVRAAPHPNLAPPRPDRIGSGVRRTPSCWRREVAFVLSRPIHRRLTAAVCLA
jgi:hypothetical protein